MAQEQLKEQLESRTQPRQSNAVGPAKVNATTVAQWLEQLAPQMARALPKHMDVDRLTRIALTTIRTTPKLLSCDKQSLMGAVMQSAQLGLEPGLLGHCYILPYKGQAQFIVGYRGMIDLARRSGNIESIQAHEVYENDLFELEYGLAEKLKHVPWHLREDKHFESGGEVKGVYMVAKFRDGGHQIHYMPTSEIEDRRRRSAAANNGPWKTDWVEMAKKTVIRAAWKWLPISIEIMRAAEQADESSRTAAEVVNEYDDAIELSSADYEEMDVDEADSTTA